MKQKKYNAYYFNFALQNDYIFVQLVKCISPGYAGLR